MSPSSDMLSTLFGGRFVFREEKQIKVSELVDLLCPPSVAPIDFRRELEIAMEEAQASNQAVVRDITSPLGSCRLRLLINDEGTLATCSEIGVRTPGRPRCDKVQSLSVRETQVLELLVSGLSNKQIAAALYLSPRTVEKHRATLHRKTGTRSLALLTRLWLESNPEQLLSRETA